MVRQSTQKVNKLKFISYSTYFLSHPVTVKYHHFQWLTVAVVANEGYFKFSLSACISVVGQNPSPGRSQCEALPVALLEQKQHCQHYPEGSQQGVSTPTKPIQY